MFLPYSSVLDFLFHWMAWGRGCRLLGFLFCWAISSALVTAVDEKMKSEVSSAPLSIRRQSQSGRDPLNLFRMLCNIPAFLSVFANPQFFQGFISIAWFVFLRRYISPWSLPFQTMLLLALLPPSQSNNILCWNMCSCSCFHFPYISIPLTSLSLEKH